MNFECLTCWGGSHPADRSTGAAGGGGAGRRRACCGPRAPAAAAAARSEHATPLSVTRGRARYRYTTSPGVVLYETHHTVRQQLKAERTVPARVGSLYCFYCMDCNSCRETTFQMSTVGLKSSCSEEEMISGHSGGAANFTLLLVLSTTRPVVIYCI